MYSQPSLQDGGYKNALLYHSTGYGAPKSPFTNYYNYPSNNPHQRVVDTRGNVQYCRYGTDDDEKCTGTETDTVYSVSNTSFTNKKSAYNGVCKRGYCIKNPDNKTVENLSDHYKIKNKSSLPSNDCTFIVSPYTYY